jgi:ATP-dependent protease HslVU (ClpYQ) peptidase subunit
MTCIVGIAHKGKCYIGGDSAGVDSSRLTLTGRADQKVFRVGEFVMGFTTSFRMGQLLAYSFNAPASRNGVTPMAYMATDFINAVRDCLKAGGFAKNENGTEKGGTFLVGYKGTIFTIYDDYQIEQSLNDFHAVGCGDLIALGSLYETRKKEPEERIRSALAASAHFSAGVRAPFNVVFA